ncbi:MAG: hypothetical protein ACLTXL_04120 [Clostridia bacterium]
MEHGAGGRIHSTGFMVMAVLIGTLFLLNCSRADTVAPEQQIQTKLSAIYGERYRDAQWRTESLESIAFQREFVQPVEYTFTEQITLVGEAAAGTSVAVCVYTVDIRTRRRSGITQNMPWERLAFFRRILHCPGQDASI